MHQANTAKDKPQPLIDDRQWPVEMVPIEKILPAPENNKIYKPVSPKDPAVKRLAKLIRKEGVLEPLVLSRDMRTLSGHRRTAAAKLARLKVVPCRIRQDVSWADGDTNRFTELLAIYNTQRVKSFDEVAREAIATANPKEANRAVSEYRQAKVGHDQLSKKAMKLGDYKPRKRISKAKDELLYDAVIPVLEELRKEHDLPISVRGLHYRVVSLEQPPLIHSGKPDSRYRNDLKSYKALVDIVARARLAGIIKWGDVIDETRPVTIWNVWNGPSEFLSNEIDGFAKGYYRDLLRSQPCHFEIILEKLALKNHIEPVAEKFRAVMTTGRGYCSLVPRYDMARRFLESGRDRLVVLMLTDLDPDGEGIAESYARSMRDDFEIENVTAIKVGITQEHVRRFKLPPSMEAKKSSSQFEKFSKEHGRFAYELEALKPSVLRQLLTKAFDEVIDQDAFNREIAAEEEDVTKLHGLRLALKSSMATLRI